MDEKTLLEVIKLVVNHFNAKIKAVEDKIPEQQTEEPVDTNAILEEVKKILG